MLLVLARPNGLRTSRLGLAIAKKNTPKAVDRNRIKRLVRESFMHNQPFRVAIDAVVIDRKGTVKKSNKELFQSLSKHWQTIINKLEHQGI